MNEASPRAAIAHIAQAQRCIGNLQFRASSIQGGRSLIKRRLLGTASAPIWSGEPHISKQN